MQGTEEVSFGAISSKRFNVIPFINSFWAFGGFSPGNIKLRRIVCDWSKGFIKHSCVEVRKSAGKFIEMSSKEESGPGSH